jgi:hypothetical protein
MGYSSRRLLASVEQREGYVVARLYELEGDEYELVATCAGRPEFVLPLLAFSARLALPDGVY